MCVLCLYLNNLCNVLCEQKKLYVCKEYSGVIE